jgi:flagellar biosynthesis GTPase FlhF
MENSPKGFHEARNAYIHHRIPVFNTGIYRNDSGLHEDIFICLDSFQSIVHTITKDSSELEAWLTFLSAVDASSVSSLINAFPFFASIYQEIADFVKKPEELITMLSQELYIMDKNMERLMVAELQEEAADEKARADKAQAYADEMQTYADELQARVEEEKAKNKKIQARVEEERARAERIQAKAEEEKSHADSEKARADDAVAKMQAMQTRLDILSLSRKEYTPEAIADKLQLSVEYVNTVLNE